MTIKLPDDMEILDKKDILEALEDWVEKDPDNRRLQCLVAMQKAAEPMRLGMELIDRMLYDKDYSDLKASEEMIRYARSIVSPFKLLAKEGANDNTR